MDPDWVDVFPIEKCGFSIAMFVSGNVVERQQGVWTFVEFKLEGLTVLSKNEKKNPDPQRAKKGHTVVCIA